jgi:hypothetical protein
MRVRTVLLTLATAALLAAPAYAATATYKGRATNMDGDFKYGAVTVKVANGRVKRIEIKSVTTTGCGGFMNVIYSAGYEGSKIIKGSNRIRDGRFNFTYQPTTDVEDQATVYKGRVSGSKVTGTFESGDLCGNAGRFTAKRR